MTKYVIKPDFYKAVPYLLANPDTWNKLSPDLQKRLIEFKATKIMPVIEETFREADTANWQLLVDSGVEVIRFSPTDAEAFLELAYDAPWKDIIAKSPELGPKLKDMLVK